MAPPVNEPGQPHDVSAQLVPMETDVVLAKRGSKVMNLMNVLRGSRVTNAKNVQTITMEMIVVRNFL